MMTFLRIACVGVLGVWLLCCTGTSVAADPLGEARAAYEQQKFPQALTSLDPLIGKDVGPPGALELRMRTYLKMGQSEKAVGDYDRLRAHRGKDDPTLLRELAVGIIAPAVLEGIGWWPPVAGVAIALLVREWQNRPMRR